MFRLFRGFVIKGGSRRVELKGDCQGVFPRVYMTQSVIAVWTDKICCLIERRVEQEDLESCQRVTKDIRSRDGYLFISIRNWRTVDIKGDERPFHYLCRCCKVESRQTTAEATFPVGFCCGPADGPARRRVVTTSSSRDSHVTCRSSISILLYTIFLWSPSHAQSITASERACSNRDE